MGPVGTAQHWEVPERGTLGAEGIQGFGEGSATPTEVWPAPDCCGGKAGLVAELAAHPQHHPQEESPRPGIVP